MLFHLKANPDKKFAVKCIPRNQVHNPNRPVEEDYSDDSVSNDEELMQNLLEQEIQIVLHLDHPNIVKFR